MISKTKQAGLALMEIMLLLSMILIITTIGLSFVNVQEKAAVETPEVMAVKHELLQPVVTDLKDYKSLSSNAAGSLKLTPVLTPEMRKEPIQPVAPEPVIVQSPQPIIEKNENHYHFEDLNSGITYLASILLVIFVLFCSFKGIGKFAKNVSVKNAIKKSQHILTAFETDINNSTTYLDYSKIITDQLRFNNAVIDQNKNSYHVPELSVVNDKLQASLTFTERSLVHNLS